MLPGFRFLVAAIVCSISLTIFGMGAAALLRAAHEQFASNSSWHATQASGFTTFLPPAEPAPVLAVLRVDPLPPQPQTPPATVTDTPATAVLPAEQPSVPPAAETVEVTTTAESPALPTPSLPAETVDTTAATVLPKTLTTPVDRIESAAPDRGMADDAARTVAAVEKLADKPRLDTTPQAAPAVPTDAVAAPTSSPQVLASADPAITTPAVPAPAPATPADDPIAAKLAALGEQPTRQERPAAGEHRASVKVASVQLRRSIMKKRQAREKQMAARRAKQRRIAERARAARQAAAQQAQFPDPF
ncbi:MAG: hypothetical protein E6848_34110, partial [Bradyrhizobium sp.]|nr:hypothetical protein [Bradyrhizobium sp.]